MRLAIAYFFLFSIYGIINIYLPLLLRTLLFSSSEIGMLIGIFETAGILFPLAISANVDKKGTYGISLFAMGVLMAVSLLPLLYFSSFFAATICLSLLALSSKGVIPIADAFATKQLKNADADYGKIRAVGSLGFVCMTLLLQFSTLVNPDHKESVIFGMFIASSIFVLTIFIVPNIWKTIAQNTQTKDSIFTTLITKRKDIFSRQLLFGLFLIFLGFVGMTPTQKFLSLYVEEVLHERVSAGLWAISAMAEIPIMFASGFLIRRFGIAKLLPFILLSVILRNMTYVLIPTVFGATIGQLFHSINFGLFHPVAVLFCAGQAKPEHRSVAITLYSVMAVGLAYILGSFLGGFIIEMGGYYVLFASFCIFPLIGIILYFRYGPTFFTRVQ